MNKCVNKMCITSFKELSFTIPIINTFLIYYCTMSVTYQPKKRKRQKTHGFLARKKTSGGKNVLKRRAQKGRSRLAV